MLNRRARLCPAIPTTLDPSRLRTTNPQDPQDLLDPLEPQNPQDLQDHRLTGYKAEKVDKYSGCILLTLRVLSYTNP